MYKLKEEYKGQDVTCFLKNKTIKLEFASQKDFAEVYKVKGWQKFITKEVVKDEKEVKKVIKAAKK